MRIFGFTAALLLAGCAAPYTWQHPGLEPALADRQREIDSAECTAFAMQSLPVPNLPAAPTSVQVTVNAVGGNPATAESDDAENSFMEGVEAQQVMQNSADTQNARSGLANACMLRRGWVKVRSGQQQQTVASAPVIQPSYSGNVTFAHTETAQSDAPLPQEIPPSPPAPRYDEWLKSQGR